ncbi:MAG: hypothetical protein HY958_12325 [Bacteroidia bacterium]|nr:hypothetical protein [Bacteroidia bacterium]
MYWNKNKITLLVLSLAALVFLFFFYGPILTAPDSFLFNNKGDAIKNYYTYMYHIKNDTSYINFQGMNYPYGEHFMYTDCHPFFTVLLKSLSKIIPSVADHSIGFINFLMIVSFLISCILLYKIFLRFKVNHFLAALGAFCIAIMAPQLFRITVHQSLSYTFFIPVSWYLLILYHDSPNKIKWSVFLLANNLFWFFTHAYLGMMAIMFNLCFLFFLLLSDFKNRSKKFEFYLSLVLQVLIPVLIFRLFIALTDTHTDRTTNPLGFFLYNAEPDDIFILNHGPLWHVLKRTTDLNQQWEAWSYVGFSTIFIILFIMVAFIKSILHKKGQEFIMHYFPDRRLNIALISSLALLIFAFGIPFKQFPALLDYIPVLKHFRATGRFTWFFYYTATVFCIFTINTLSYDYFKKGKKYLAFAFIIILPSLYIAEGISYHTEASYNTSRYPNLFDRKKLDAFYVDALKNINPTKYQAIIPLPFFYNGSENFARPTPNEITQHTFIISYHSKLPVCGAYLTRSGISESKKSIQLISPDFYEKPIKNDIKSSKPFLIIQSSEPMTEYENALLNKCTPLYKNSQVTLFEITPEQLFGNSAEKEITSFETLRHDLRNKSGFMVKDTLSFLYFNDFENSPVAVSFSGKGAFIGDKKGKNTFAGFKPNTFLKGKEYRVSAWMYNGQQDALNDYLRIIVEEYNPAQKECRSTEVLAYESEVINGNWSLIELTFSVQNPANEISLVSIGKEESKGKIYLDNLLIREKGQDVFKILKKENEKIKELFKNNHSIITKP